MTNDQAQPQGHPPARSARSAARHRRPPERRPIRRSAGIALVASGLLVVALGIGGWALVKHGPAPSGAGERPASQAHGTSHGTSRGTSRGTSPGGGFAAGAPGPPGRISGPAKRPKHSTAARPYWLLIPAIGVSTNLVRLGLTAQDTLQVPPTAAVAGWYAGSPRPGEIGSSIIIGHIDSRLGPGIFYHLDQMRRGQYIYVIRGDHSVAVFEVTRLRTYVKSSFPRNAVYGPVPDSELRLITCGGTFDFATGSYLSNVVVYAVLIK